MDACMHRVALAPFRQESSTWPRWRSSIECLSELSHSRVHCIAAAQLYIDDRTLWIPRSTLETGTSSKFESVLGLTYLYVQITITWGPTHYYQEYMCAVGQVSDMINTFSCSRSCVAEVVVMSESEILASGSAKAEAAEHPTPTTPH